MGSSSRSLWQKRKEPFKQGPVLGTSSAPKKKEVKIPNLIACTEKGVFFIKDEQVAPIEMMADRTYFSVSWNNNDLYFAGPDCMHKYYRELNDASFYGVPMPTFKKIYVIPIGILGETSEGELDVRDFDLTEGNRRKKQPVPELREKKENCSVTFVENEIICQEDNEIKKVMLPEIIHDVKIIEDGFTHNGQPFPIKEWKSVC